ncbi:MAG: PEP-CTERM sorting domain-containing protein, partial [Armatimonadota bacterium]|nr:PEP-CTERM sorting domain-containing protein [Armatimonadota bacterium]
GVEGAAPDFCGPPAAFVLAAVTAHADLIAYYPFEGDANHARGNNRHGTVYGAVLAAGKWLGLLLRRRGRLHLEYVGNPGDRVWGGFPVTAGQWAFVAVVCNQPEKSPMLYVDGGMMTGTTNLGWGYDDTVIGGVHPGVGWSDYFSGTIDEVFLFDEALTKEELDPIRLNGVPSQGNETPEPATALLLGAGVPAVLWRRRGAARRYSSAPGGTPSRMR